jgi:urease accessory protein
MATSPLKLLIPRRPGPAAWVYTSTYGGGLVAGDEIDLQVRLGPQAAGVMSTQSSTKVYKNPVGQPCRQTIRATVEEGALLVLAPDPITCYAGARYEQRQQIQLHRGGNIVVVDWLTSGRRARAERWAFSRYQSRLDVDLDQERVLTDALLLDPADGPLDSPFRLGRFHCLAVVVLIGDRLEEASRNLLERVGEKPIDRRARLIDSASPIRQGVVLRVLGETTELVARYLSVALSFLGEFLGETPWARKW